MTDTNGSARPESPIDDPDATRRIGLVSYIKRYFHQRAADKKPENPSDRTARRAADATVVMAIFTIVLACVSIGTLQLLIQGGADTHDLVVANRDAADAASDQADAAQQFSDTAEEINAGISEASEQLKAAADNARNSLETTKSAMRLEQRAWVSYGNIDFSAPEIGKPVNATISIQNTGKTFARKVRAFSHVSFAPPPLTTEKALIAVETKQTVPDESIGVLSPNAGYKSILKGNLPVDDTDKSRISGDWYTYIWGDISYEDIFHRPHETVFLLL